MSGEQEPLRISEHRIADMGVILIEEERCVMALITHIVIAIIGSIFFMMSFLGLYKPGK
jgi:hypothetical protein